MSHNDLLQGLIWYVVFVYSTVCHEAGHAWSAQKLGDSTAYEGGQVSLDPIPHVRREPFGMVVVPLLSFFMTHQMFGWASAPYNPRWASQYPRRAAVMALAGPAANLALVLIAAVVMRVALSTGYFELPDSLGMSSLVDGTGSGFSAFAAMIVSVVFSMNLLLFSFNLLPLPPFDGSCLPLLVLSPRMAAQYQELLWNPSARLVGLLIAFQGFRYVFPSIEVFALRLLYSGGI